MHVASETWSNGDSLLEGQEEVRRWMCVRAIVFRFQMLYFSLDRAFRYQQTTPIGPEQSLV